MLHPAWAPSHSHGILHPYHCNSIVSVIPCVIVSIVTILISNTCSDFVRQRENHLGYSLVFPVRFKIPNGDIGASQLFEPQLENIVETLRFAPEKVLTPVVTGQPNDAGHSVTTRSTSCSRSRRERLHDGLADRVPLSMGPRVEDRRRNKKYGLDWISLENSSVQPFEQILFSPRTGLYRACANHLAELEC